MSETTKRPLFVVIEGPDGSGKSNFAAKLLGEIHRLGEQAVLLKTPSEYFTGSNARMAIEGDGNPIPETWPFLFAADMINLYDVDISPLLRSGITVLVDRWLPSTLVYQRAMMLERGWPLHDAREAGDMLERYFGLFVKRSPDADIHVHAPTDIRVARLRDRHESERDSSDDDWSPDWFEGQKDDFHRQVGLLYEQHYSRSDAITVIGKDGWEESEPRRVAALLEIKFPDWLNGSAQPA